MISLWFKDEHNQIWHGPLVCGGKTLFECNGEYHEQNEPDPSWIVIDIKEAHMQTDAIVALNKYVVEIEVTKEMPIDERARQVAVRAHRHQTRWNNDAYITHPTRVAATFDDPIVRAIAYLHDVVEDTELTLDDLKRFGFCQEILDGVEAVTKRDGESYLDFVIRAKGNSKGREVKIADIKDNLSDLTDRNKIMRDKYQLALWVLNR